MTHPRRVLVVDDDDVVREGYRAHFDANPGLGVCGEVTDGAQAVAAYEQLRPDVVLMDLQMPNVSGVDATAEICRRWPDACVVALTTFGTRDYVTAALKAGARGYLIKDFDPPALAEAVEQALAGEMPLSATVRRELVESLLAERGAAPPAPRSAHRLTKRELELLQWLSQGLTNQQIGAQMFVSEGSIKQYLAHIGDKLQARSRTQILMRAVQLGVIDPFADPAADG